MDAVEIDSEILEVSKKYFFVDDLYNDYDKNRNRLTIYNEDAMTHVEKCNKKYDYILLDIFNDNEPINEFLSLNFIKKSNDILNINGIYSTNYIINKGLEEKFLNYIDNLKKIYKYIYCINK